MSLFAEQFYRLVHVYVFGAGSHKAHAFTSREDALKAALAAHEDVDVLQKLCEGRKMPAELRMDLWKVAFGSQSERKRAYILHVGAAGVSGSVSTSGYPRQLDRPPGL